ncbi:DUF3016 domain-containing protein [Dokdonella sp.]|uniref:DUF3016 domain-containing protein n=1 Tax=Dokdonella sp. TaxID=2291710 RepID=UPI00352713EE
MTIQARLNAVLCSLTLLIGFGLCAPSVIAAQKPTVRVDWTDPSQFSEMQNRSGFNQTSPKVWLGEFSSTIRRHARRVLETGQSLSVTITDVTLAGTLRSGSRTSGVRVVDRNTPPRIKLSFTLTGADGQILLNGDRDLGSPNSMSPGLADSSNPYIHEDRLLIEWMDREFGSHED